jgi:hypothetical protein
MMQRTYQRIARSLLKGQPKAKIRGRLLGKKFVTSKKSLHRTVQSRRWNLFWNLKYRR